MRIWNSEYKYFLQYVTEKNPVFSYVSRLRGGKQGTKAILATKHLFCLYFFGNHCHTKFIYIIAVDTLNDLFAWILPVKRLGTSAGPI